MASLSLYTSIGNPELNEQLFEDCSYFEEMCWRAKNETDPENRGHAQYEVDRMVKANNDALEEERMKAHESLIEYLNDNIGSLFDGIHFHSNDVETRHEVTFHIGQMMSPLKEEGHIYDYKVVCDQSNNPPSVIDRHELRVDLFFKDVHGGIFHYPYNKTGLSAAIDVDLSVPTPVGNSGSSRPGVNQRNPSVGGQQYSAGAGISGIGNLVGNLSASNTINANQTFATVSWDSGTISLEAPRSTSAILPEMMFNTFDDADQPIKLTLKPEGSIGAYEALQLAMMIQASITSPRQFSVYKFVTKNNLERHFKFSK